MEDGAIIDIIDTQEVTHMILVLDLPDKLTCHQHTSETAFFSMRPFSPFFFARVEESSHARANGSDGARVGGPFSKKHSDKGVVVAGAGVGLEVTRTQKPGEATNLIKTLIASYRPGARLIPPKCGTPIIRQLGMLQDITTRWTATLLAMKPS